MPKFRVSVEETQYWVYSYEVEAEDEETAKDIGRNIFYDGAQSDDSDLLDSTVTSVKVKEYENA